jgi:hypothetical protein
LKRGPIWNYYNVREKPGANTCSGLSKANVLPSGR